MKNSRLFPWACAFAVSAVMSVLAQADPVKLPAGMRVPLELQHHVNSVYVPTGASVYFRVAEDVKIDGKTLISSGTLVTGKMEQANSRGMVGRSGSMNLGVRWVKAVDGTNVPVEADVSRQGRSRTGATVGWIIFWGLPGLITKGVNPYMERGTMIDANVMGDTAINPAPIDAAPAAAAAPAEPPLALAIKNYKFEGDSVDHLVFDIERNRDLKTVTFEVTPPSALTDPAASLESVQLVEFDGVAVPEEVHATSATNSAITFDGWSIARFCRDGTTALKFRGRSASGQVFDGVYQMRISVKKKH
jgi:hypothetical protein